MIVKNKSTLALYLPINSLLDHGEFAVEIAHYESVQAALCALSRFNQVSHNSGDTIPNTLPVLVASLIKLVREFGLAPKDYGLTEV